MDTSTSKEGTSVFEEIKQIDEQGNEFWSARKLAKALGYTDFRNFTSVITKAIDAIKNSNQEIESHVFEYN